MNILFISHRVPYPPDKGEKIIAFQTIKHLSRRHKIFLYCLCDNRNDLQYKGELEKYCASVNIYRINTFFSSLRMAAYLFTKYPLTWAYFFSRRMKRGINKIVNEGAIDLVLVYCSSVAQYVLNNKGCAKIIDFVDVDSDKWSDFSKHARFPRSLIFSLEANRLKKWEGMICEIFNAALVVTDNEKEKLAKINPPCKDKVHVVNIGVDFDYFRLARSQKENHAIAYGMRIYRYGKYRLDCRQ